MMKLEPYLERAREAICEWEADWGAFGPHASTEIDGRSFEEALDEYVDRLKGNYPFFHPRYAGQMLKPPHPAAVVGYLAAMLINPNNHALDGGPPTSAMEKEVVRQIAGMFGYPDDALGHLTGGGTIANLEAMWVAREAHPDRGVAVSDQAHYTHARLGNVLKMETHIVPSDERGRMQLEALEPAVRRGEIGTIVVTAGTTGLGAVDPIADVVDWRDRYGVRIHVDAAYGGFFALSAADPSSPLDEDTRRHLKAIGTCDSIVVDPHKHGLQPYGCGCVLFRNPEAGRVFRHDSPYTYFTSEELHLGEISFECSRPGAAAGALWLTLQVLPLEDATGLGAVVTAGLRTARRWHRRLEKSDALRSYMSPELDIVTYFPDPPSQPEQTARTTRAVSALSQQIFERGMDRTEAPVFLSILREDAGRFITCHADFAADTTDVRLLRSVMMKPEHEHYVDELYQLVMDAVRS